MLEKTGHDDGKKNVWKERYNYKGSLQKHQKTHLQVIKHVLLKEKNST